MFNLALGLGSAGKPCFIYLFFICPLSKNRCVPHLSAKMPCQSIAEAPAGSPLAVLMPLLPWNLHNRFLFGRFPQQNFLDNLVEAVARDRLVGRCGDLEKVGSGWFLILCSDIFKVGRPEVPRVMGGGFRARLLSHSLLSVVAQPFSELK